MRTITDRQEIARLINIDRIPTIIMDISKDNGYENCYTGGDVLVETEKGDLIRGEVNMWSDDPRNAPAVNIDGEGFTVPYAYNSIKVMGLPISIHSGFGYHDIKNMLRYRNCPVIKENQEVLVVFDDPIFNLCVLRKFKAGKAKKFYDTVVTLTPVD